MTENKHWLSQIKLGEWYSNAQYNYRPRNDKERNLMHSCYEEGYNNGFYSGLAEGRKEKCLEQNKDGTIRHCEVMKENKICEEIIIGEQQEINKLKAQIEKMKCCQNCLFFFSGGCRKGIKGCWCCNKWELAK